LFTESSSLAFELSLRWSVGTVASSWAQVSSTHVRGYSSMLPLSGNAGGAALMQRSHVALAALAASPFLIEGM